MRMIQKPDRSMDWNNDEINFFDPTHTKETAAGLSRDDIEYAKMAEKENKKLQDNMTDEQKKMLADLESGKILRLTKLIPESKKPAI